MCSPIRLTRPGADTTTSGGRPNRVLKAASASLTTPDGTEEAYRGGDRNYRERMDAKTLLVAVVFGALMGWGLGRFLVDLRPALAGLGFGFLWGAIVALLGLTDDPVMVGSSLMLGCAAGLVALTPRLWSARRPSATPSPRS